MPSRAADESGPRLAGLRAPGESGQAAVELVAVLPCVALLAMALWQLAVAGQAAWLAGAAARSAARAAAVGGDTLGAARAVLPGSLERGLRIRTDRDGAVRVTIAVPKVVGGGRLTTVESRARFQPQA
jgi:hypothetical protein